MSTTKIEWTRNPDGTAGKTWGPIRGCSRVSPGCLNCYAEKIAARFSDPGQPFETFAKRKPQPHWTGKVELVEEHLEDPLHWKKPTRIFVNSMSDLFHEDLPIEHLQRIFNVMRRADWHQYQILTKRSERLLALSRELPWAPHIWMGVSVENEKYQFRIDDLRRTGARIKFLSLEPLLGPLSHLDLEGIGWVIAGSESGSGARPMQEEWVREIRDQCEVAAIPFFYKQKLVKGHKVSTPELDGKSYAEFPQTLPLFL